jgi:hypothetical protein
MRTKPVSPTKKFLSLCLLLAATIILLGHGQIASAQWTPNGTNVYYNGGNVGIGNSGPSSRLQVLGGDISLGSDDGANNPTLNNGKTLRFRNHFLSGLGAYRDVAGIFGGFEENGSASRGYLSFLTDSSDQLSERVRITSAGNVGIGTTTPANRLHVVAAYDGDGVRLVGSTSGPIDPAFSLYDGATARGSLGLAEVATAFSGSASAGDIVLRADTGKLHLQTGTGAASLTISSGNIGIGTTTPGYKLEVNGEINATGLRINGTPISTGGSSQWSGTGSISYNGGNVGIGTTTPGYKLDVAGNINSSATITGNNIVAKYQDVAEWVPSSEQVSAGTVVVLDSTKSNQVVSSSEAYDTRVAGVVSEQPGIALGESGAGKVLVATTGRVLVKVDASRGPIHIGDLLVTSEVPGAAMKSETISVGGVQIHRPGTLIGKALEPLEKGSGKILVLLSLQ